MKYSFRSYMAMPLLASYLLFADALAQTSVVLSPTEDAGLGYHDNYNTANTNYNGAIHFSGFCQPGTIGGINSGRGVMDFDLSTIPVGSTILGAFLSLSAIGPFGPMGPVTTIGHVGQNECALRRITSAWADNTVTWNTQPTASMQNEVMLNTSNYALENYININVTALVQDMVDDPINSYGFMLQLVNETVSRGLAFHSSLASDPDKRPTLLVVYGDCGGQGISDTESARYALTISPNIASPGATLRMDLDFAPNIACSLAMIDASGRTVQTEQVHRWPCEMIVPSEANGVYSVRLTDPQGEVLGIARLVVR